MKTKKIIFVGPYGGGKIPTNGASIKNYYILNKLKEFSQKVISIDTELWKSNPLILLRLLLTIILNPNATFIISLNNLSAYRLLGIFRVLPSKRSIYYWVIGGSIADWIREGKVNKKNYEVVNKFLVEGDSMVDTLKECGFDNAICVPNFKKISYIPKKKSGTDVVEFIFLSRITPPKGCDLILSVTKQLNEKYKNRFIVDFYGEIAPDYQTFRDKVVSLPNVSYKGFIDLRDTKNYDIISQYDAMLFPTFWHGEGFPGIMIDAFIAGLPVIATDWHLNKDIVNSGKNGFLINPNDPGELYEAMEYCILNSETIRKMSTICQKYAMKYDVDNVVNHKLFNEIGLI